ncbi:MAG TPA: response regulator transcription factor [Aggregatilineales bacterium]|nr:response regulator transcription factor [Aggregatilineales bacterium]
MPTVLLVEDTSELARTIARELELSGYEVLLAQDGITALDLHTRHHPDLVILDWMLPKLDGLQVLRKLRQSAATPVLMLTARDDEADRVLGLEVGADDYLTKPFSLRELMARVRAMLRRVELFQQTLSADRERADEIVEYGPLRLDATAYQAVLDDAVIELSQAEFDLLYLLVRNPGRAFGRAYLYETVWGEPSLGSDRTVDNTILRLRKKLAALGDAIETVRGVGYRLRRQDE